MRVDENGNAWWDVLAWIGLGLFVAAATIITAGMAGAVIGGIAGGIIGGAVSGWTAEGILTGMGIGFGVGAIAGAIIGGTVGANGWYNARALEFTNTGTNSEVVLGKYINNSRYSYDMVAQGRGSTYFGTSQARWHEVKNMFGVGEKGSSKGEWYNPKTGDQLHPDLNHPLPKGPHWGWRNKILKILQDIFK